MSGAGKKVKARHPFNTEKFEKILEQNRQATIDAVFGEAMYLALKAKHGSGLLGHARMDDVAVEQMTEIMAPLMDALYYQATASFARVFSGMYRDQRIKDYLRSRSAASFGKTGGRPAGKRAPHLEWLERALRTQEHQDAYPQLTATEHFEELRLRPEMTGDEDDDGHLVFCERQLEQWGHVDGKKEPVVTQSAVTETLTRIRKG
ncbi:MAG: hypothetical protein Q8O38_10475 [Sulfurimicrobium sp.]|nr:hypothetical protein [Sulfurimicrobium sp.]